jgi:Omp85 superfamily domain
MRSARTGGYDGTWCRVGWTRFGSTVVLLGGVMPVHGVPVQAQASGGSGPSPPRRVSIAAPVRPTLQRHAWYVYAVPTSEKLTGLKVTLIGAYLWRTALDGATRPSTVFQHSAYTANHQLLIALGGDLWAPQNSRNLNFQAVYSRFPAPFFGIGARTAQSAQELFTPRTVVLAVTAQQEIRPHTYAQLGLQLLHMSVGNLVPGGLLISHTIPGSTGYTTVAPEIGMVFDSRDHLFDPKSGAFIQGRVRVNLPPLGGSTGFQLFSLDARVYRSVRPGSVLALEGAFAGASGTVPFEELPQLGGSELRAYVYGRWRDRTALRAQMEWRQHAVWRFGAVAFVGAGAIGSGVGALWSAPVRTTYGAGLRFNLSTKENANFSMDYARGQERANVVSFGFAEAF